MNDWSRIDQLLLCYLLSEALRDPEMKQERFEYLFLSCVSLKLVMGEIKTFIFVLCSVKSEHLSFFCQISAEPADGRGLAEGHHAPVSVFGSCVPSQMFFTLMNRHIILLAGCSWQSKKPCMTFYLLVDTSGTIIPLSTGISLPALISWTC